MENLSQSPKKVISLQGVVLSCGVPVGPPIFFRGARIGAAVYID